MPEAAASHLYVMQNHLGLIKIGQSTDVERRRKQLARADCCEIRTVHIVPGGGINETEILLLLAEHRLYGEWFSGHWRALEAVRTVLGLPKSMEWPFTASTADAVHAWAAQLENHRENESREKLSLRLIRDLRSIPPSGADETTRFHYDWKIWEMLWKYDAGLSPWVSVTEDRNGNEVRLATRYADDAPQPLPAFTSDVTAALQIWPDDVRPADWSGSAIECCIEGLTIRRTRMMERNRGPSGTLHQN